MAQHECEECKAGAPEWMVTFADLMSLLLTFFVLLLSFSNTEIIKFRTMAGSVRNALGLKSEFEISDMPKGSKIVPYDNPREGDGEDVDKAAEQMKKELEEVLDKTGSAANGAVKVTKRGVVLQLRGDMLFGSGDARIETSAHDTLEAIAEYASAQGRVVDVVGHTDDVPIATAVYPSNWELSAARAGQAVRYLVERGVSSEMVRAIGQADSKPDQPNDTSEGRSANRRIEFIFLTPPEAPPEGSLDDIVQQSGDAADSQVDAEEAAAPAAGEPAPAEAGPATPQADAVPAAEGEANE